jgi:hypothetical protein
MKKIQEDSPGLFMLKLRHKFAYQDLQSYVSDSADDVSKVRLAPFLAARTLDDAIAQRGCLETYLAVSSVGDLYYSLKEMAG